MILLPLLLCLTNPVLIPHDNNRNHSCLFSIRNYLNDWGTIGMQNKTDGKKQIRSSRQRETIRDFLTGRKDHPTAEVIFSGVRDSLPHISLGTVYRNLLLMRDLKEIRTVCVGDGLIHFDPNPGEHVHFVCRECGRVMDLDLPEADPAAAMNALSFQGKITGCSTLYEGICPGCLDPEAE